MKRGESLPRSNRIYGKSSTYHIMLRGINKGRIFFNDKDRKNLLKY